MPNGTARGGGILPYNVAYALAILGEYINNELEEQSKLEGEPQADPVVNARLASLALNWLKDDIDRIAANRAKREETERARAELQHEFRVIDDKWKSAIELQRSFRAAVANRELQHEFRVIDDKWKLSEDLQRSFRAAVANRELQHEFRVIDDKWKPSEDLQRSFRAAVANRELQHEFRVIDDEWKPVIELQQELRGIYAKYELRKELRAIDATHGLTGHPKPYSANYKAKKARDAQIASWQLKQELRAIDATHGLTGHPRPCYANYKAEEARNAQIASWQLKQELRTIDNQYKTRAELQAELRAIDGKHELRKELRAIDAKYELHKELRAIDHKYEPRIYLQRARSAVAAAYRSQCELAVELGANHAAVKTVRACCNLAWALVNVYNAVHALTTLRQQEIVVEGDAHATELADQALLHVLEAIFHLSDYQERWVEDHSADVSGVFAAMAGAVMDDPSTLPTGAAPSTLLDDVVAAQQQAQCVTL